jgi:hypothetical protein
MHLYSQQNMLVRAVHPDPGTTVNNETTFRSDVNDTLNELLFRTQCKGMFQ